MKLREILCLVIALMTMASCASNRCGISGKKFKEQKYIYYSHFKKQHR